MPADARVAAAKTAAWRELSAIEQNRGQGGPSIEAARQSLAWALRLQPADSTEVREILARAYVRLSLALTVGHGPDDEALKTVEQALALYPKGGGECESKFACRVSYASAVAQLATVHSFAHRSRESVRIHEGFEKELLEWVRADPDNMALRRLLRNARFRQASSLRSIFQIGASLEKYRESIADAVLVAERDPAHPESACQTISSRAKYGETLVQATDRVGEAETELRMALRLADSHASDSLNCLDARKIVVINLARVAERKGDWEGGMEWRRETVRNAVRYANLTPGEPLGMVIEAGANFELGLGGLEAAKHGNAQARLLEARQALNRSAEIYVELAKMGNPLLNQYVQWPERTQALLRKIEQALQQ